MDRDTSPARYMGRVSAKELDLEMMVLSRSKNAASIGRHGRTRVGRRGPKTRPAGGSGGRNFLGKKFVDLGLFGVCSPGRGVVWPQAQTDSSSPPAPFPRLLHTPPEEPLPFPGRFARIRLV